MMVDINSPAVVLNNIIMNISFSCCQKLTRSFWKSQKVIYSKFCKSCKIWMTCIFGYLIKANLAYLVFTVLVFMDSFFLIIWLHFTDLGLKREFLPFKLPDLWQILHVSLTQLVNLDEHDLQIQIHWIVEFHTERSNPNCSCSNSALTRQKSECALKAFPIPTFPFNCCPLS